MQSSIKKMREEYRNEIRKKDLKQIINDKRIKIKNQSNYNLEYYSLNYINSFVECNVNIKN